MKKSELIDHMTVRHGGQFETETDEPIVLDQISLESLRYMHTVLHEQMEQDHAIKSDEQLFQDRIRDFYRAGMNLVEAWDTDSFNADERFPLPERLRPPLSLDEWLAELLNHYTGGS